MRGDGSSGDAANRARLPGESSTPARESDPYSADMTSDVARQPTAEDLACAAATKEAMGYFTDQGWSYPPTRVAQAIELMGTVGRYLTDAVEHSGQLDSADLDRRYEFVCALTEMAYEQRRLYWLLDRWAQECATEGTLNGIDAVWTAHRFRDAQKHATALGDALSDAHARIGRDIDRSCGEHAHAADRADDDGDDPRTW